MIESSHYQVIVFINERVSQNIWVDGIILYVADLKFVVSPFLSGHFVEIELNLISF
jgi:hypothetical protein